MGREGEQMGGESLEMQKMKALAVTLEVDGIVAKKRWLQLLETQNWNKIAPQAFSAIFASKHLQLSIKNSVTEYSISGCSYWASDDILY